MVYCLLHAKELKTKSLRHMSTVILGHFLSDSVVPLEERFTVNSYIGHLWEVFGYYVLNHEIQNTAI